LLAQGEGFNVSSLCLVTLSSGIQHQRKALEQSGHVAVIIGSQSSLYR
jgi:hypothetical protein